MPYGLLSRIGIDCILSQGVEGLQGDGCIYELSSSPPTITTPENVRPGDYVKLRLWFPDDSSHTLTVLGEVHWIKNHWMRVDLLLTSSDDQTRLRNFVAVEHVSSLASRRMCEQILIRA